MVAYPSLAGGGTLGSGRIDSPKMLAPGRKISMLRAAIAAQGSQSTARLAARLFTD
jgi:hypothetical protein